VAKNYFGSTLALDADSNFETLFIGCGNCSSDYGKQHGVIYLYEPNKGPGRKNTWSATQKISHRNLEGLGRDRIVPHKDLLMASTTTRHYPVLLFRRKGKDTYEPEQILGVGESINSFDVYDDTIVLAASNVASGVIPNVGAIYILAPAKLAAPKGKPQPVQWSLQQVLRPDPISEGLLFGNSMSLDKNRLAVIEGIKPDTLAWVNPDTSQFTSLALNTPVAINFLGTGDVTMTRTSAIGSPISLDTWSKTFTTPVGSLSNPDWVLGPRFYFELSCDTTGNSGSTVSYEFQFAGGLETTAQLFFIDFDWSEKVTIKAYDASNNLIPFADTTIELSPGGESTPRYADISWTASGGATGLLRNINDDSESNIIASISSSTSIHRLVYDFNFEEVDSEGATIRFQISALTMLGSKRNIYVFEKDSSIGKWSVQQRFEYGATQSYSMDIVLKESQMLLATNRSRVQLYDQFSSADCLYVSLEDLFGDGWDTAQLRITAPDGSQQYYQSRCDLGNPYQFRFCPNHLDEDGIYHFEVIDATKAKNFWEIQWRVYNSATAKWYVGHCDTRMDFEWDSSSQMFTARKMDRIASNVTCTYCAPPPTDKPSPIFRSRALKGSRPRWQTYHPTTTPAPTLSNTDSGVNWRVATLGLNSLATTGWFRNDYKGAAYYVSDAKSRRLITSGTLCPDEATDKQCWIDLPDGDYSIRVGGSLLGNPSDIQFKYCRMDRYAPGQTHINVKIRDGECHSLSSHAKAAYCKNMNAAIVVAIEIVILGISNGHSLTAADDDALTTSIANALPGLTKSDVRIVSALPSADGVYVSAQLSLHESSGYDALNVEGIENALDLIDTYMAGTGPLAIRDGLQSSEHQTILSTSTSVQFVSADLAGSRDDFFGGDALTADNVEKVIDYYDVEPAPVPSVYSTNAIPHFISTSGYLLAIGALIVLIVGVLVSYRRAATNIKSYSEVDVTEHVPRRVQLKDLNLRTPSISELQQLVESVSHSLEYSIITSHRRTNFLSFLRLETGDLSWRWECNIGFSIQKFVG
jgi:hypothetical protein